jgi:hypothetical protein
LWSAAADGHGNNGQQGVNLAMDKVTMTVSAGPYFAGNNIDVTVNILDGLTGQPLDDVTVTPSFTSNAAFGIFTSLNNFEQNNNPQNTDATGTAGFTLRTLDYSGTFNISLAISQLPSGVSGGGTETSSQQVFVASFGANATMSSLTSVLNFAGPAETATLKLTDQDFLHNPVPGDTVGWSGTGTLSPASNAGVTDANGMLTDTFTPSSDTTQNVSANFGGISLTTSVNFVTMDSWINSSGGIWNDAANASKNWSEGHIPTSGEGVWIGSTGTYTVQVTDTESVYGLGTMSTATLEIGSSGDLLVSGTGNSGIAGALTIDTNGEFVAQHGTVHLNGAVTNNSLIAAQLGATIDIANGVSGTGTIVADGAVVNVAGSLASTQAITIEGASVVHLAQAEAGSISFSGAGMLALDAAPAGGMTVHNFSIGDSIDLTNVAFAGATLAMSGNTLTIHNGAVSESINFAEAHSLSDFTLAAGPLGGTDIVYNDPALSYTHAVSDTVLSLDTNSHTLGGINDSDVAFITGNKSGGTVADDYWYVNGNLISFHDEALNNASGPLLAGISNTGVVVSSPSDGHGSQYGATYSGLFDSSTDLLDLSGGTTTLYQGPFFLMGVQPQFIVEAFGVNDSNTVVGYILDANGLVSGNNTHTVNVTPPPGAGGNSVIVPHEYGFATNNGYTLLDAGVASDVPSDITATHLSSFSFGGATPSGGVVNTVLTGINDNGLAVGYYMDGHSIQHSFIFDTIHGTWTFIPDMSVSSGTFATSTVATAINDDGLVVGYYGLDAGGSDQPLAPSGSGAGLDKGFVYDYNASVAAGHAVFLTTNFTTAEGSSLALTGINDTGMVTGDVGSDQVVANLNPIVTIDTGGTLYVTTATYDTYNFAGGTGELVITDPSDFHGHIAGFTGTAPDAGHSGGVDLTTENFLVQNAGLNFSFWYPASGILHIDDHFHGPMNLNFESYTGNIAITPDGNGGTFIYDPPAGPATIDANELYIVTQASSDTVTFTGTTGELQLAAPASFTGHVAGFAGTAPDAAHSDVLDLAGIDFNSTKFAETYQSATGELTVTDGTNSAKFTLDNFNGTLGFASDGNGGTAITAESSLNAAQMAVVPATVADPAAQPAASTIVPTAPNQTVTGNAVSDTFVFNFANVGQTTVTNFHAATDTLQFNSQLFANVQAALNATQDDGHGNTVITLDAHDTITLSGVVKAQLHASDFHFA